MTPPLKCIARYSYDCSTPYLISHVFSFTSLFLLFVFYFVSNFLTCIDQNNFSKVGQYIYIYNCQSCIGRQGFLQTFSELSQCFHFRNVPSPNQHRRGYLTLGFRLKTFCIRLSSPQPETARPLQSSSNIRFVVRDLSSSVVFRLYLLLLRVVNI